MVVQKRSTVATEQKGDSMAQKLAELTRKRSSGSSSPITGSYCFLRQKSYPHCSHNGYYGIFTRMSYKWPLLICSLWNKKQTQVQHLDHFNCVTQVNTIVTFIAASFAGYFTTHGSIVSSSSKSNTNSSVSSPAFGAVSM